MIKRLICWWKGHAKIHFWGNGPDQEFCRCHRCGIDLPFRSHWNTFSNLKIRHSDLVPDGWIGFETTETVLWTDGKTWLDVPKMPKFEMDNPFERETEPEVDLLRYKECDSRRDLGR